MRRDVQRALLLAYGTYESTPRQPPLVLSCRWRSCFEKQSLQFQSRRSCRPLAETLEESDVQSITLARGS